MMPIIVLEHINDYMWNTSTGDAVELKHLDALSRQLPWFRVSYLRPRYYKNTETFENATRQAAHFNVLRQLDSDRSRDHLKNDIGAVATLMRAKASVWTRPSDGKRCSISKSLDEPRLYAVQLNACSYNTRRPYNCGRISAMGRL